MARRVLQEARDQRAAGKGGDPRFELGEARLGQQRLARHVETDRDQRRRARGGERAKDDARGFRIVPDVEFRRRRHVAGALERTAHQHEPLDLMDKLRRAGQCGGDVGERSGRDQHEFALVGAGRGANRVDRMGRRGRRRVDSDSSA